MSNLRYLIPNTFTALNFLLGIWAILYATGFLETPFSDNSAIIFACHMVVYCVLFDKLDGFAAKALKASSHFGAQFDSLADLVAFGIAPAFCLFCAYQSFVPEWYSSHKGMLLVCLSLYVISAAIRLARYNAAKDESKSDWFVGLPSTLSGGINVAVIIIAYKYNFFVADNDFLLIPALILAVSAVLMLSPLRLPKLKLRDSKLINSAQFIGISTCYFCGFAMIYPEYILFVASGYSIIGVIYGLITKQESNKGEHLAHNDKTAHI